MRKIICGLIFFLCLVVNAQADCTGKIIDVQVGEQGSILVIAQFAVDGVDEPGVDRKTYFPEQLKGLTKAQVKVGLNNYLDIRCDQINQAKYRQVVSKSPDVESREVLRQNVLDAINVYKSEITALQRTVIETPVLVDSDGDNSYDKKVWVKADGTKRIEVLATPIPIN